VEEGMAVLVLGQLAGMVSSRGKVRKLWIVGPVIALLVLIAVGALLRYRLILPGGGTAVSGSEGTSGQSNGEGLVQVKIPDGDSGPTVELFSKDGKYPENTLADFMYFVPLISPVGVTAFTSTGNQQAGHLLSYDRGEGDGDFDVSCEFRMKGSGSFKDDFDVDGMIEWNKKAAGKKKVLTNILSYIKFKGEGYGRIEARGTAADSNMTVDHVEVHFDARGAESPVTVGLYDVDISRKENGSYRRFNYKVARITTLTFERSSSAPKMDIKISAVGKTEEDLGTLAHVKGFLGNFFIDPIEIDPLGNETMLNFGLALYEKKATFTFPTARNLKNIN
jgi:hypothetical protein